MAYREHCKSRLAKTTLLILHDKPDKLVFGPDLKELLHKFPVTNTAAALQVGQPTYNPHNY